MKIGVVYSSYNGPLPWQSGQPVKFGAFLPPERAPEFCPCIYFEFPILRPVTPIVWAAPKRKGTYFQPDLFDWSRCNRTEVPDRDPSIRAIVGDGFAGKTLPWHSFITESPEMTIALDCARQLWAPFTTLEGASKLLPALLEMTKSEREDFMQRLGQTRNEKTLRGLRENLCIAVCWENWEKHQSTYEQRREHMERSGLPLSIEAFKKRVGPRGLNLPKRFRE